MPVDFYLASALLLREVVESLSLLGFPKGGRAVPDISEDPGLCRVIGPPRGAVGLWWLLTGSLRGAVSPSL